MGMEFGYVPELEKQPTYEILSNPETRERLKERMERFVEVVHDRKVDALVFLDRSARPLSWMFQDLWNGMYQEEKKPDVKYVNIGTSSHVHDGVAHLLRSRYWGSYDHGTVGSTSDLLRHTVIDAEEKDVWFQTNQIPREWQNSMVEYMEVSEELQKIFQKSFDGKSVLIVDEMGASGKSQMAALGFFTLAFPDARKWEATSLFYSRQFHYPKNDGESSGINEDRQIIPWLQELGMAGVLELPDETLLSGTISNEHIQKIIPLVQNITNDLQENIKKFNFSEDRKHLEKNLERMDLYEHPEKMIERAWRLRKELKHLTAEVLTDRAKK